MDLEILVVSDRLRELETLWRPSGSKSIHKEQRPSTLQDKRIPAAPVAFVSQEMLPATRLGLESYCIMGKLVWRHEDDYVKKGPARTVVKISVDAPSYFQETPTIR